MAARKACGTEESFLQKEPLSGTPADPFPEVKYRAPMSLPVD